MKRNRIPLIVLGSWLLLLFVVVAVFGWARVDNNEFQPQDDVRVYLDPAGHPFCLWVRT